MSFDKQDQANPIDAGTPVVTPTPADKPSVLFTIGDRSYHTPEEAANKIQNADSHIAKIEAENADNLKTIAELTGKLSSESKVNDLLDKLSNGTKDEQTAQISTPALNSNDIVKQVRDELSQESAQQVCKINMDNAMEQAKKGLGDDFINLVKKKADTLGMPMADVDRLASNNPTAFVELFVGATAQSVSITDSSYNATAVSNQQPPSETRPSFMKLRGVKARSDEIRRRMAALE